MKESFILEKVHHLLLGDLCACTQLREKETMDPQCRGITELAVIFLSDA